MHSLCLQYLNVRIQKEANDLKLVLEETMLWLEVDRQCQGSLISLSLSLMTNIFFGLRYLRLHSVWQTENAEQSATWLCTLTAQLGLLPYKFAPILFFFYVIITRLTSLSISLSLIQVQGLL